jgi:hypothetical protein
VASTQKSTGGTRKSTANRSRAASASKSASGTRSAKARSNGRATTAQSASSKKTTRPSAQKSSRNGAKRSQNGTAKRATASRNGSARSGSARPRAAANQPQSTADALKRRGSELFHAADRAGGPALTVAAAAAGLVGGLVLRQRPRMADPGIARRSRNILRDVDTAAALEGLGKATAELGKRSKLIARQLDQVGDRAERFGKILS